MTEMGVHSLRQNSHEMSSELPEENIFAFGTQAAGLIEEWQNEKQQEIEGNKKILQLQKLAFDVPNSSQETQERKILFRSQPKRSANLTPAPDPKKMKKKTKRKEKKKKEKSDDCSILATKTGKLQLIKNRINQQVRSREKIKGNQKGKIFSSLVNKIYSENEWKQVRETLISRFLAPLSRSEIDLDCTIQRQTEITNCYEKDSISYDTISSPSCFTKEDFKVLYNITGDLCKVRVLEKENDFTGYEENDADSQDRGMFDTRSGVLERRGSDVSFVSDSESEMAEMDADNVENYAMLLKALVKGKERLMKSKEDISRFDFDYIDSVNNNGGELNDLSSDKFASYDINANQNDSSAFNELQRLTEYSAKLHSQSQSQLQLRSQPNSVLNLEIGRTQEDPMVISSLSSTEGTNSFAKKNDKAVSLFKNPIGSPKKIQVLESVYQNSAQLTSFKMEQLKAHQESCKVDSFYEDEVESDNGLNGDQDFSIVLTSPKKVKRQLANQSCEVVNTSSPILDPVSNTESLKINDPLKNINQLPSLIRSSTIETSEVPQRNTDISIIDIEQISNSSSDSEGEDNMDQLIMTLEKKNTTISDKRMNIHDDRTDTQISSQRSISDNLENGANDISLIQVFSSQENKQMEIQIDNYGEAELDSEPANQDLISYDDHVGTPVVQRAESTQNTFSNDIPKRIAKNSISEESDTSDQDDMFFSAVSFKPSARSEIPDFLTSDKNKKASKSVLERNFSIAENVQEESVTLEPPSQQEEDSDIESQLDFESYTTARLKSQIDEWGLKPVKSRTAMLELLKNTSKMINRDLLAASISQRNSQNQVLSDDSQGTPCPTGNLLKFSQAQLKEGEAQREKELESVHIIKKARYSKVRDILVNDQETYLKIIMYEPLNIVSVCDLINRGHDLDIDQSAVCEILTYFGICYTETGYKGGSQSQSAMTGSEAEDAMEMEAELGLEAGLEYDNAIINNESQ